jgi:mycoredoxin-dependent peroxiredoxin
MSNKIKLNTPAPDFELENFDGTPLRLSDFRGKKHVLLVFNRGFV